jgi:catechol 2,3-dioxygenase-like lactoylglutathione lyase family enzyme
VFDHVGLNVTNYEASRAFYEQALAPLGWSVVMAFDEWKAAGFGTSDKPEFWISQREPYGTGTHVEFRRKYRSTQDAGRASQRRFTVASAAFSFVCAPLPAARLETCARDSGFSSPFARDERWRRGQTVGAPQPRRTAV